MRSRRSLSVPVFGYPVVRIELNQREVATLRRASQVFEELRDRAREIDPDFELDDRDTELALAEHECRDWSTRPWMTLEGRLVMGVLE
jgi:hypothetical protein